MKNVSRVLGNGELAELLRFAHSYLQGGRSKLIGVVLLEALLMSMTGVGLLLILPLLALLGFGSDTGDHAIWQTMRASLDSVGLDLTLELGIVIFIAAVCLRAVLGWRRTTWQVEVEQQFQMGLRVGLYDRLTRTQLNRLQRLRTSHFVQSTQVEIRSRARNR